MKEVNLSNGKLVIMPSTWKTLYLGDSNKSTHAYIVNVRNCLDESIENVLIVTDDDNASFSKEKAWCVLLNVDPKYYDCLIREVELISAKCTEYPNGKYTDIFGKEVTLDDWKNGTSLYIEEVNKPNHDYWQHVHFIDESIG